MATEKTMLQIVQDACTDVGQPRPSIVASASLETPRRMLRLLNKAGKQLTREFEWPELRDTETFTAVAAEEQVRPSSTGFSRLAPNSTLWHVGTQKQVIGPMTSEQWNRLHVTTITGPDFYWTMMGKRFAIYPVPSTSDQFRYSFVSTRWCSDATSTTFKTEFTADDDLHVLDDELLTLELVWRWKQSIGLDYAEDMASANRYKETLYAGLRMPPVITLSDPWQNDLPPNYWPGVING